MQLQLHQSIDGKSRRAWVGWKFMQALRSLPSRISVLRHTKLSQGFLFRIAAALLCPAILVGVTFAFRFYLVTFYSPRPLMLLFVLPILLSAYLCGIWGGLLATFLSGVGVAIFPSPDSFLRDDHQVLDFVQWFVFWFTGISISLIVRRLRKFEYMARQESEQRAYVSRILDLGVEVAGLGIFDHELSTGEIYCSNHLRQFLGLTPTEKVFYESVFNRIFEDDRAPLLEAISRARDPLSDGRLSYESRIYNGDGSIRWIKVQSMTLFDDELGKPRKPIRRVGTLIDITEQRQREEVALKAKASLELLNQQLQCSNDELEHFAAVAAHDLGSPLKSIRSWIEILALQLPHQCHPDVNRAIYYIKNCADRADALIGDLLEISRVQNVATQVAVVNLNECIQSVLQMHKMQIDENQAAIKCEDLPSVMGNLGHLESLFGNLLRNAIIYRRPDVYPLIVVGCLDRNEEFWEFFVSDNGIGIATEDCDKIFSIFKRLHSVNEYPGTGIGLAICKKIVELNGGKLWVNSTKGKGSVFRFTYPKSSID